MPTPPAVPNTYAELRRQVERVLITGRQAVEEAWVNTYHETGRLIHTHVLRHRGRADYGAGVYVRLSADTGVSVRTLQECVHFYRLFPIARPVAQFGWNRCRLLCQVGDAQARQKLIAELRQGRLPTVELKDRVRALNAAARAVARNPVAAEPAPVVQVLRPRQGRPDLYRVIDRGGGLAVDVGFKLYRPLGGLDAGKLHAGQIVRWADKKFGPAPEAGSGDLFTYRAEVRRVVDGDTLQVSVHLPDYEMDEKLRLRGLDCPELDSPEGKAAKHYTETLIARSAEVVITTSKVDKYDRYLADVHLRQPDGEWLLLNNALLQNGHAMPMGNEAMDEWMP